MNGFHFAAIALLLTAFDTASAQQVHAPQLAPSSSRPTPIRAASTSGSGAVQSTMPSASIPPSSLVIGPCDVLDDGSSENALGLASPTGTDVLWMQRQGDAGQSTVVFSISTCWGTPAFPGSGPANGSTARFGIWQDNDNDGDPTTGVLTLVAGPLNVVVAGTDMDQFQVLSLTQPAVISGVYFIGVSSEGSYPAPLDQSVPAGGRSWIVANGSGARTIDYTNLAGEPIPPHQAFSPGVFLVRADCLAKGTVEETCSGDGSVMNCPCNNNAPPIPVQGCLWMTNNPPVLSSTGGHLEGVTGTVASIAAPVGTQLKLNCTGHRPSTQAVSVLMQGQNPTTFVSTYGNGLLCIQSPLRRLYINTPTPGSLTEPDDSQTPTIKISDRAAALGDVYFPGVLRGYQLLYRDPLGLCSTYNASNGVLAVWAP